MKTLTGAAVFSARPYLYFNRVNLSNRSPKIIKLFLTFFIIISTFLPETTLIEGRLLQGCDVKSDLCEKNEKCFPDGFFGQCAEQSQYSSIMDLSLFPNEINKEFLFLTLEYNNNNGNWDDDVSQCYITLYKFSLLHNLEYQPFLCNGENVKKFIDIINNFQQNFKKINEEEFNKIKENFINNNQIKNNENDQENKIKTSDIDIKKINKKNEPIQNVNNIIDTNKNEFIPVMYVEKDESLPVNVDDIYIPESNLISQIGDLIDNNDSDNKSELLVVPLDELLKDSSNGNVINDEFDLPSSYQYPLNNPLVENDDDEELIPTDGNDIFYREERQLPTIIETPYESNSIEVVPVTVSDSSLDNINDNSNNDNALDDIIAIPVELEEVTVYEKPIDEEIPLVEEIPMKYTNELPNKNIPLSKEIISPELFDNLALDEFLLERYPESNIEIEEAIPLNSEANGQQILLKKDDEKYITDDLGLDNTEHKIVKGNSEVSMIEGNRIYINIKRDNLTDEQIIALANYLQDKIGDPNDLYFYDFLFENNQLSFKASSVGSITENSDNSKDKKEKRLDSPSGVAQAVYKRRKDIMTLSGIDVNEAGIGSGKNVVPIAKAGSDWLFKPILLVCMATVTSLLIVLLTQVCKTKKKNILAGGFYPEVIDHIDNLENGKGRTSGAYEELCRRRMSEIGVNGFNHDGSVTNKTKLGGTSSQNSSVSSWPDEAFLNSCNLDISTGHVILSFLQSYLDNPQKIHQEWESLASYQSPNDQITIASKPENLPKNRNQQILPYDESLIRLGSPTSSPSLKNTYINASSIFDVNPKHPSYIAAESPVSATIPNFWQMIWEKGVTIIVNLTTKEDMTIGRCEKYWPDDGSRVYDNYEIHLVSEHIWSEDYMVRSFYLKNITTNETRTVTQFHYLAWPENKIVPNQKTLLDFRRKVNKSYRGHASPILVHCSEGLGRTGAYLLLDMIANRITSGVKEINMAASLEYLRDNRNGAVKTEEQYKMVFSCLAEEVTSLIKSLPN
ncbi:IA-2 ortholog [Strongyloides ratti]|uniref:IA-2 ortholog n=1 Tax=Strongyloides ratti TaxID=34506 RepID=A0A090LM04_STRRB|nr:IA-2 ortholog [Strongyloides ratti]CEF68595.1 IA-2 ortholog [Strongyloides ratti]